MASKLITLARKIREGERQHPEATGVFSNLLEHIALAAKIISREVNKAGLIDMLGITGETNVQGEEVQKLDVYANDTMIQMLRSCGFLAGMASEEVEDVIPVPQNGSQGKYIVLFDPLDGSSNIEANVSIGTIFSILRKTSEDDLATHDDFLRPGVEQVAAGYVIYGSSTVLVLTTGGGVHGFTLDASVGEFLLSHEDIRIPSRGKIFSVNMGNFERFDDTITDYVRHLISTERDGGPYSLRYIGSLVADFHRNLLYGGIFMYPADQKNANGKLRLLYEANPLALIVERAGGRASTGWQDILKIQPDKLHERVPLFIGSAEDVTEAESFVQANRG